MSKVCVVIPTYNEAENIGRLVKAIDRVVEGVAGWDVSVLVVDDESPDGTADVVKTLTTENLKLELITGPKKGLGAAYIRGFRYAIDNFGPDYIMEMDADFQHEPKDILRFLAEAEKGEEFIIGSRYVPGGDIPGWTFRRKVYSWGANVLARQIAGVGGVSDCTSGFRCIDARLFKSFDLGDIKANGYAFQLNLLHVAVRKGLKIKEIPILFPDREAGESKLGRKDISEFFFLAFMLRFKKYHWRKQGGLRKEENVVQSVSQSK